ncbi:MAG: glycosyltransferase [Candidatus Hadarchaeum sp.]
MTIISTDMQAGVGGLPRNEFHKQIMSDSVWSRTSLRLLRSFGRGRPWNHLGFAHKAGRVLKTVLSEEHRRATVVHIHGVFSYLGSLASRAAFRAKIPYVLEPYGAYDPVCFWSNHWPLKLIYHNLLTRWELQKAAAIRVASEFEAIPLRRIVDDCHVPIAIIPYGVDPPASVLHAKPEMTDLGMGPIIGFLSRLTKKKRPEWVLHAASRLKSEFPTLQVWIAGSDDGHRRVVEMTISKLNAQNWARVFPFLQGEDKKKFFDSLSLLVLPSKDESLGAVVLEAMAHGVPVLVTPGVASHVYVDASGCGLTVGDSVDAVATGIRRLLLADKAELGRRGREYVEKHLTWPVIGKQVDNLYYNVLDKKNQWYVY